MINAGDLRWVAKIEQQPAGKLPSGALNEDQWIFLGNRRCKIEEITGTKVNDGTSRRKAIAWYRIEMRTMAAVTPKCRLTIKGRPFNGLIVYVDNVRRGVDTVTLTCVTSRTGT